MGIVFLRTAILYLIIILAMRVLGKKQIGELQPSELVVSILISDLAAVPMQSTNVPLLHGILPILTLVAFELILSLGALRFPFLRKLFYGAPSIVVHNGIIDQKELRRLRFSPDDLFEELRMQNITNLDDISYAIFETNGQLSVVLKPPAQPATRGDLKVAVPDAGISRLLVRNGRLCRESLQLSGRDEVWVRQKLAEHHLSRIEDVYLFAADEAGNVNILAKEHAK